MKLIHKARWPALLIAIGILGSASSCKRTPKDVNPPPSPPRPAGTHFVVAVDLSTSLTPTDRANHQALLNSLVNSLGFGDRLVLLKAHAAGVHDTSTIHTVPMPVPRGSKPLRREEDALTRTRQRAARLATALFRNGPTAGSDLFATLHTAGERAREVPGARTVLVLMSDMLQCTGEVCMERRNGVPDSAWISARKAQGLIPPLVQVCVSVVGADASTPRGVKVREFWRQYFREAGADFSESRYVHGASSPAMLRCDRADGGAPATRE